MAEGGRALIAAILVDKGVQAVHLDVVSEHADHLRRGEVCGGDMGVDENNVSVHRNFTNTHYNRNSQFIAHLSISGLNL